MSSITYTGSAYLPGVDDEVSVTALIDEEQDTVSIEFDREIGGSASWHGTSVEINQRLKYSEIVFRTTNLPVETVDLVWKFNASKLDNSLAAVIVPQPNKLRVSGEKGFILNK
ncbi:uncharacterized protein METZ01_LOCUS275681 [marine metagenome]|uniref:Uncharacterized protein n=1 Tax=marine metagenome TaxID=408172 RepID=A0A382KIL9_9ZZZZ